MTIRSFLLALTFAAQLSAGSAIITFTPLDVVVGGTPTLTRTFRADLSGVGLSEIWSITIQDASFGLGGAPGRFSAFDLDAIILSYDYCEDGTCVTSLSPEDAFDYSAAGTLFKPGTQRPPVEPTLFGTTSGGTEVDEAVATLGFFDANATTAIPGAFGFVSLGDGGRISFNLKQGFDPAGLYLYIGEVGDNGEVASGVSSVSDSPASAVPEPGTMAFVSVALGGLVIVGRRVKFARA